MTDRAASSGRSAHPVVAVLTALTALSAVAVAGSTFFVIAFGWGYVLAAIALGALPLAGIAGIVVRHRLKSRYPQDRICRCPRGDVADAWMMGRWTLISSGPLEAKLEIVEGILAALERRSEVIAVVGVSANRHAAERQLLELLDVTSIGAQAVLDQPVSRFTSDERLRVRARRQELRNLLDEQRSE